MAEGRKISFGIRLERRLCEEVYRTLLIGGFPGSGSMARCPTTSNFWKGASTVISKVQRLLNNVVEIDRAVAGDTARMPRSVT